ncbi:VWA domain-containing protein [Hamadaea tsunoensis]|uniref:VWA domain-containing protein n=1 Tax=Hamadaea tsunoensis TaxID=53368 RepID=UPI000418C1DD|nr:VWA domain-containing protein [Hamadaea tsunoensis]
MSLTWPWALAALLAVPLLFALRWWSNRRRKRLAVRVSSIALIRAAVPGRTSWKRRVPLILFAVGLVALGTGATRPRATVEVPSNATSILLAIDVSTSMCSTDVSPNRLMAARAAATEFVKAQRGTKIGIVAFSGITGLVVAPTTDTDALIAAIDTLRTARGTAIGQGILTSLDAISEINPNVAPTGVTLTPDKDGVASAAGFEPDTIIVLTDGVNTQGVDPVTAAEQAQARRVRVYTIGFGTTTPAPFVCSPDQIADGGGNFGGFGGFGGRFGGGGPRSQEIDEDALNKVADTTGGKYFRAEDAGQLSKVLRDLPRNIVVQKRNVEITVWFVLAGLLLTVGGVVLSIAWNRSVR